MEGPWVVVTSGAGVQEVRLPTVTSQWADFKNQKNGGRKKKQLKICFPYSGGVNKGQFPIVTKRWYGEFSEPRDSDARNR